MDSREIANFTLSGREQRAVRDERNAEIMLMAQELRCFAVIPGKDSAESLLSLNFAVRSWGEIRKKNIVPNLFALMGPVLIIERNPLAIDIVELVHAEADKVIQALLLDSGNIAFDVPICLRGSWRSFNDISTRAIPKPIKTNRELCISISDKVDLCGKDRTAKSGFIYSF